MTWVIVELSLAELLELNKQKMYATEENALVLLESDPDSLNFLDLPSKN
ncbi:hypothetical protein ACFLVG_04025 [Chloroflexota bacterium]